MQSLSRINSKKPQATRGGGLLTSTPAALPPSSSDDDDDLEVVASTAASTSTAEAGTPRRRALSVDSNAIDEEEFEVPPAGKRRKVAAAPKGKGKGVKKGKGKEKEKVPDFVPSVPWPEHFVQLEKTFKALNTVFTFCSARKSMATTFDTLKGSVENLLKRPLEIQDIAQIKSLLPLLVTFAYIDSELLRVHSAGGDEKARREQKRRELDEAYALAGKPDQPGRPKNEVVLLFSFNDGELKSSNGVGKVFSRKKSSKMSTEPTKPPDPVPKFTTASMTALITKRNDKFRAAVSELLVACAVHQPPQDPIELLLAATEDHLPVKPADENQKGLREKRDDAEFYQRNPDQRLSIEKIIEEIKEEDEYRGQVVKGGHRIVDAREAVYGELETNLSDAIWDALYATKKITQLYLHQALAINHLAVGDNVIVSTSTSSGKSLIYQIPVLKALEEDLGATAFFIFPTKALAQDQKRGLAELLFVCEGMQDVKIATFDGDTPKEDRDHIRDNANVIFTNPDMLHLTILPREDSWRRFFRNLKYVVVDELHTYSGLFGCHVAFIMRRLRRICAALGNRHVQSVSCSATIANPAEHMEAIFGIENVVVVDVDGSPAGRKEHLIWNPPFIDDHDVKQGRVSTFTEASRVFRFLLDRGVRVIVFCRVRNQCEILMKQVRSDLLVEGRSDIAARVMSYRSGYSAADRRKIEQELFSGQLLGVIATTALELGVDIGSLDAVITVGFPYTLPGLRQQAGRAGRRNKDSLAMLICDPFPLDQHYARNPSEIFDSPYTGLSLDLTNPIVLEGHLQCAADEMPIHPIDDLPYFGDSLPEICAARLVGDEEGFYHCHPRCKPYPAKLVPIRNTEDDSYAIVNISNGRNEVIEEIEVSRAIFTTYEGAVYMHQGRTFLVKEVNHDRKMATVEQAAIEWQTRVRDYTDVDAMEALAIRQVRDSPCTAFYGTVKVTSVVFGYFKTDRRNNILDAVDISSPPFIRSSHGIWIDIPRSALEILILKNLHPAGSIHAAAHALMSLTPIVAMSAEGDVRTECKQPEKELASRASARKRPARLILYDSSGMSGGVCAKAFDHVSDLLAQAADTIANCACEEGCPACVASNFCSGGNTIVSKLGALVVLDSILGRAIDVDSIPQQELAVGVVPGGSIDLAAAGVRVRRVFKGARLARGVMEEEEMEEDEREERERALKELMGM